MNYVGLIGRITKEPELKVTESGRKFVRFTLAVERYNNQTDFILCVAWEKRAEVIANYVRKGNRIAIQGNLNVRTYQSGNENRSITEVIVDNVEFIESKNGSGSRPNVDSMNEPSFLDDPVDNDSNDDTDFPF